MKLRWIQNLLCAALAALSLLWSGGCGKGTSAANVVTVNVSSSVGPTLILGQSTTLTATVSGATNTNVNWQPAQPVPCQYTIIPSGKTTPNAAVNCPSDGSFGTRTNDQATGTSTYTAPGSLPSQTTYPSLQIIITAQSAQDTSKTGKATLTLISGIGVNLTPTTASVPTKEPQQFFVTLTNDLKSQGVKWLVTQNVPSTTTTNGVTTTTTYDQLPTCSPSCGTITPDTNNPNLAIYTGPDAVPTAITPAQKNNVNDPANVTIVATSVADSKGLAIGTITVVAGGPIAFNGITPTIAPAGATLWDIYLDAPNISSASKIVLNYQDGANPPNVIGTKQFDSTGGQIKILFPIPIITTTTTNGVTTTKVSNPQSTGARLRLLAQDLVNPPGVASVLVTVTDPAEPVCPPTCTAPATGPPPSAFTFKFVPVRPTSVATVPDDVVQGGLTQSTRVIVDGGYFGPGGNLAGVFFESPGNAISQDANNPSSSRQLNALLSTSQINTGNPGLYPLYVSSTANPAPSPNNPAVTNISVFPDYTTAKPGVSGTQPSVGQNPSAIDVDPTLGVLVVAETGSNTIEFFRVGSGSLTSLGTVASTTAAPINVPTGVSVNRNNHTVAVVNYGALVKDTSGNLVPSGQSVTVLPIPGAPGTAITPFSVDLTGALQGSVTPAPMPYSIGVDSDSNLAIVAYSVTSASSASNVGFIVNLNPNTADANGKATNPYGCLLGQAVNSSSNKYGQCLTAQVTLNTGTYPHVAVAPHGHLALVTPGGSGFVRGVDVTKPSNANVILSSTLTAGLVTVTVDTTKCPPGVPPTSTSTSNPCPLQMVPGVTGTVVITGVTPGNSANTALFNGVFTAAVTSSNSFTYVVPSTVSDTSTGGTVFYGTPDLLFPITSTLQGVAIDPITSTAALADANTTGTNGPQIDLLSALDQSTSSITFFANCTAFTNPCASSPELLATTDVAWQPYTNEVVSYNPKQGLVSVSDPVGRNRYAIVSGLGPSALDFTVANGTTNILTLWGGVAVDPATNQAFVVESGQAACSTCTPAVAAQPGRIEIINLGPAASNTPKPTHVSELIVPSPTPGPGVIGGVPGALVPQATLTSAQPLAGVQIFGTGFASGARVRLDSVDITTKGGTIDNIAANGREIDVTIPAFFLSAPQAPHHYALDVISNGVQSNVTDFIVIQAVDMSKICTDTNMNPVNSVPTSVAIADQLANGPFAPIAVVSNNGCNSISIIDISPGSATFGQFIGSPIAVGTGPQGVAISERRGLVVVANHGGNNASIIDLTQNPPTKKVPDVATGTSPTGVAVNDATGAAITANTGSNTITMINYGLLYPAAGTTPPTTLTPVSIGGIQEPIAVAIDPDRGTNNQGIAVVTAVQLSSGSAPTGALAVVEIGLQTPTLSQTIASGFVAGTPTGIVFDPVVATNTANPGVFFANSSGSNVITEFNPDTGGGSSVNVGINPTSLGINPQTGAILTSNSASNTVSIVDTLSNPFKTQKTLGIPGSPTFGVAIDQFTNLAVIVDQANQRVLLFPMPN
jgi:DNA-binding beta-propeller fold protein YncE